MEEKDLKQIGQMFDERLEQALPKAFTKAFVDLWDNHLEPILSDLQGQVSQLPTKSYLDDKLANLYN